MGFRGQYKNKRDANEPDIVDAFRKMGCTVEHLDKPLDLLVGYQGRTYLVEVKAEKKDLNKTQEDWVKGWRGGFYLVRSIDDVKECLRLWPVRVRAAE